MDTCNFQGGDVSLIHGAQGSGNAWMNVFHVPMTLMSVEDVHGPSGEYQVKSMHFCAGDFSP